MAWILPAASPYKSSRTVQSSGDAWVAKRRSWCAAERTTLQSAPRARITTPRSPTASSSMIPYGAPCITPASACAPALDPIAAWRVERVLDKIFVREKLNPPKRSIGSVVAPSTKAQTSIVIVGGGAAGLAAADMLRREGYSDPLTMVSADDTPPYDRPNLS